MPPRRKHGKQEQEKPMVAASLPSASSPVAATEMARPVEKATLASGAAGATHPPVAATAMAAPVEKATLASGAAGARHPTMPRDYAASAPDAGVASAPTSVVAKQGGASIKQAAGASSSTGPGASSRQVWLPKAPIIGAASAQKKMSAKAQIQSCFYPKFESINSDKEIRIEMIQMVSNGSASMEVTLKHSGVLFTYAGCHGGAYAKTSLGDLHTAVGMFLLSRLFNEAWGSEASKMQSEFSEALEKNRVSISMELVSAVLGDNGQRPNNDYAVVTAVAELGHGRPRFYSTIEMIKFCRKWRLPTNHVWLFSTRKSITLFFKAYDALCEEGTATSVCRVLDKIADKAVPGSKDYTESQGEILEALTVRAVKHESPERMAELLINFPLPSLDGVGTYSGKNLQEICAANISDAKKIEMLLKTVDSSICPNHLDWHGNIYPDGQTQKADRQIIIEFLKAEPADHATKELQEMISLMKNIGFFPAAFKCWNCHNFGSSTDGNSCHRILIDVCSESNFRRYQQEIGRNHGLWPPYRSFFVDINLFTGNNQRAAELSKGGEVLPKNINSTLDVDSFAADGLAGGHSNLMLKLNFLPFKLRTILIRDGLPTLFQDGKNAYRTFYQSQMRIWGISAVKKEKLSELLEEWALHITEKCGDEQLSPSTYLGEAEPFLKKYAKRKRSKANLALIGSAGGLVQPEKLLSIFDEVGDIQTVDVALKPKGLIVFFAGMPGCLNSDLCKEILKSPAGLDNSIPLHYMKEDLIRGKYWTKVAEELKKQPSRIILADKNAPNEAVWNQIDEMCRKTETIAIPVIPDCEGRNSNPLSLEALAVFMFCVLEPANQSEILEKGYELLKFYHLYEGKNRRKFEDDMFSSFGSLVKMPLLKPDRFPLPPVVKHALESGISLFKLHQATYGSVAPTEGSCAEPYYGRWQLWEVRLRTALSDNTDYFNSIQVPLSSAVQKVLDQLKSTCKKYWIS